MYRTCFFGLALTVTQIGGCCSDGDGGLEEDSLEMMVEDAEAPEPGVYKLVVDDTVLEPAGCRVVPAEAPAWSLDLGALPDQEGSFEAVETFAGYPSEYVCDYAEGTLGCARMTVVDYSEFAELEARVTYVASIEGSFEAGVFTAAFSNEVVCEGQGCEFVGEDWQVESFPCASFGQLTATPEE